MKVNITIATPGTEEHPAREVILEAVTHLETTRDNIARTRILAQVPEGVSDEDASAYFFYHPACVTCSEGTLTIREAEQPDRVEDVRRMTVESFLNLPAPIFMEWIGAVVADNPHLLTENETSEKKV